MDTTTLLIIIVVVLAVAFIISRNRGTYGGNSYPRNMNTGPERPTYDDPDYSSTGSIGGTEVDQPAPRERSVAMRVAAATTIQTIAVGAVLAAAAASA